MRFLLLMLFLMTAVTVQAEEKAAEKTKSPWGAIGILIYEPWDKPAGKYDFGGQTINTYLGVSYKLSANDKIDVLHRMEHKNSPADNDASYDWVRTNFNYKRSNILTEDKHGVKMGFHYRLRYYGTNVRRDADFRMYNRFGFNFSKSLTEKLSVNISPYVAIFDRRDPNKIGTTKTYYYVPFGADYAINDIFSVGALFEYITLHNHKDLNNDSFDITLAINAQVHKKITLSLVAAKSGIMTNQNEELFSDDLAKGIGYSLEAVFVLF